jgi:hypothetical protein
VYVRIAAVNAMGEGDGQQPTPTHERPRQLPKAPLGVRLEVTGPGALTVGYEPPDNDGGDAVTLFRVEWDVDPGWASAARLPHRGSVLVPAASHLRHTLAGLHTGTTYYVRVAAGNRVGFGLPSTDAPPGRAPLRQVPGRPFGVHAGAAPAHCRSLRVTFAPPVVPHHGLFCSGGGTANRTAPGPCPPGSMGGGGAAADGGAPVAGYELQVAASPSFGDAVRLAVAVDAAAPGAPLDVAVGPHSGANLQPGQVYYVRVAARNAVGTGPFCGRAGLSCEGAPLVAAPSAAC